MFMMSSGDNSTGDNNSTGGNNNDDGAGEQETFHIYILSFAYGLMMVGWCYLWLSGPVSTGGDLKLGS